MSSLRKLEKVPEEVVDAKLVTRRAEHVYISGRPGSRFSKVPISFRAR